MAGFKDFFVSNFPSLGKYKRWAVAFATSRKGDANSYSQYGEDQVIHQILEEANVKQGWYVDVGANHPTDISNTYLLYRKGWKGVVIEPNTELIKLFSKFRPGDIALPVGCGSENGIFQFNISKTPVLSSFSKLTEGTVANKVYVPVLRLDDALGNIYAGPIAFLSIDVEGLNLEVLKGATLTLQRTFLLCIEFETEADKSSFAALLGDGFELVREIQCNLIYRNKRALAI